MLRGLISLAWYGGAIGDMLSSWEQAGFFSYLLPFLIIFALVFGVLTQIKLFKENKVINPIIALAVALISISLPIVPQFFSAIFPMLGIALAVILVILILIGLFVDPNSKGIMYALLGVGAVIAIIVLVQTAGALGWTSFYWWQENWPMIVGVVFILAVVGIIVGVSSRNKGQGGVTPKQYNPFWGK